MIKLIDSGIAPRGIIVIGLVPMGIVTFGVVDMGLINACVVGCGLIVYGIKEIELIKKTLSRWDFYICIASSKNIKRVSSEDLSLYSVDA